MNRKDFVPNLIGRQVKHAEANSTDSGTKIDFWFGEDRFDPASFTAPDQNGEK